MTLITYLLAVFIISYIITHFTTPLVIKSHVNKKLVGVDFHKYHKPEIPEMGGLSIVVGFTIALLAVSILYESTNPHFEFKSIIAALGVFLLASFIGYIDDKHKLHHHQKPLLLLLSAAPLVLLKTGIPQIDLPFITLDFTDIFGYNLAIIYWIIIVPLGVTGAANVSNMLAGFNGLLSGLAVVGSAAITIIALLLGIPEVALIFCAMTAAQLAFLYFNKAPAKIFPGDLGTLGYGGLFAAGIIIGNFEFAGLIILLPHVLNASSSLLSVGSFFEEKHFYNEKVSAFQVTPDGLMSFNTLAKPLTLCKLLLYNKPQTENRLVFKIIIISIISALIAILYIWI